MEKQEICKKKLEDKRNENGITTYNELCESILRSEQIDGDDINIRISDDVNNFSDSTKSQKDENEKTPIKSNTTENQNNDCFLSLSKIKKSPSSKWLPQINDVISIPDNNAKQSSHTIFLPEDSIKLEEFVDESDEHNVSLREKDSERNCTQPGIENVQISNEFMSGVCVKLEKLECIDNLLSGFSSNSKTDRSRKSKLECKKLLNNISSTAIRNTTRNKNKNNTNKKNIQKKSPKKKLLTVSTAFMRNKVHETESSKENKKQVSNKDSKLLKNRNKILNNESICLNDRRSRRLSGKNPELPGKELLCTKSSKANLLLTNVKKIANSRTVSKTAVVIKQSSRSIPSSKVKSKKSNLKTKKLVGIRKTDTIETTSNHSIQSKIKKDDTDPSLLSAYESVEEYLKTTDVLYECLCCDQKYHQLEQVKNHVRGHFPDVVTS